MMDENISIYSTEDLTTLEKAYDSSPIDMPESETLLQREYQLDKNKFQRAYKDWNRESRAMLEITDLQSSQPMWLSPRQAEKVDRAIREGRDSVELL